MKKGLTEIAFILDKSGSMSGLEMDTIGGFNSMIAKQKEIDGKCCVTTVLFNNNFELLHDRIDIKAVSPISKEEYQVGGCTALLDAIGMTITKINNAQKHTASKYRAEKVMFVIITDGLENSSKSYTAKKVKDMIENKKKKCEWEFIFLGANIDAVDAGEKIGIDRDNSVTYHADSYGTKLNFEVVCEAVENFRGEGIIKKTCLNKIRENYKNTEKRK